MAQSKPKRKRVTLTVDSYNSGSEGDVESDECTHIPEKIKKKRKEKKGQVMEEGIEEKAAGEGWADAMAKILQKTISDQGSVVLAKSKSYEKEKKKEKKESEERKQIKDTKKLWEELAYVKPNISHKDAERRLQRTATRGVVQLFNAVKKEQKTLETKLTEVGASERKRAKVESSMTKGQFLNLLKKSACKGHHQGNGISETQVLETKQSSTWDVLRDNFMMGATMKDWDKESESETEANERT